MYRVVLTITNIYYLSHYNLYNYFFFPIVCQGNHTLSQCTLNSKPNLYTKVENSYAHVSLHDVINAFPTQYTGMYWYCI